jgi:hypothetical protein
MATKKIVELECDLCDRKAGPNAEGKYPSGWVSIDIKGLTFNESHTYDHVSFEVCPKCALAVMKTINKRSS